MSYAVLVTTTSFQDAPGAHHEQLRATGWTVRRARGPLNEDQMMDLVGEVDAIICGDDDYTSKVMDKALPRLRIISKYGIGLDRIDVRAATDRGIAVGFTPGVNHTTVAEHVFALMLGRTRHLIEEIAHTRAGEWTRLTGNEICGKTLGIIGLGRIGQEVAVRARAFGMSVVAQSMEWDKGFVDRTGIEMLEHVDEVLARADILTLHVPLTPESRHLLNQDSFSKMKRGALLINTARGELVDIEALLQALDSGQLLGYCADVLEQEPPPPDHPLLQHPRCYVTPHIGSRTVENVERQARRAIENVAAYLGGHADQAVLANARELKLCEKTQEKEREP